MPENTFYRLYILTDTGFQKLQEGIEEAHRVKKTEREQLSEKEKDQTYPLLHDNLPGNSDFVKRVNQFKLANFCQLDRNTVKSILSRKGVRKNTLDQLTSKLDEYLENLQKPFDNDDIEECQHPFRQEEAFFDLKGWEEIDIEEVESATQNTKKWRLIVEGDIDNLTQQKYERLRDFIKKLAEDGTQKVIKISKGSIVIEFEGSPEGFERIKALFDSGELTEIAGFPIQEISALAEQQTQPTQLSQWLQGVFAPLWESVDGLFTPEQPRFAFRQRTEGVSRRKTIVFNELEDRQVELVATIIPVEMPRVKVMVQIVPSAGATHLPEDLHIQLVDESDAENPEGEVFEAQENLEFNAEVGDAFSIIIEQGRYRVVERFIV